MFIITLVFIVNCVRELWNILSHCRINCSDWKITRFKSTHRSTYINVKQPSHLHTNAFCKCNYRMDLWWKVSFDLDVSARADRLKPRVQSESVTDSVSLSCQKNAPFASNHARSLCFYVLCLSVCLSTTSPPLSLSHTRTYARAQSSQLWRCSYQTQVLDSTGLRRRTTALSGRRKPMPRDATYCQPPSKLIFF